MAVEIKSVKSSGDLRKFVNFPYELYAGCENWVPALKGDEFDNFNPEKNGAFEYCESECFLAVRDGKTVGRVAAIINRNANARWNENVVRFGWLDFIEDEDVLKALLDTVEEWGRRRGCVKSKGPLGFTDVDKAGLLVEGFENLSPFTCIYNYPYYGTMLGKLGYSKDVDWTQRVVNIGTTLPKRYVYAAKIEEMFKIHIFKPRNMKEMGRKYGMSIFHIYNETFARIFQFSPLSDAQIAKYLKTYIPILSTDYAALCLNEKDEPVGFAFCVPSLSKAVKKAGGKLFPFGILHILHALRHNDTLEALLIGVLPEYQDKGVSTLLFKYIHENCIRNGVTRMILNPQLEDNYKAQSLFNRDTEPYMRRRAYSKEL